MSEMANNLNENFKLKENNQLIPNQNINYENINNAKNQLSQPSNNNINQPFINNENIGVQNEQNVFNQYNNIPNNQQQQNNLSNNIPFINNENINYNQPNNNPMININGQNPENNNIKGDGKILNFCKLLLRFLCVFFSSCLGVIGLGFCIIFSIAFYTLCTKGIDLGD